MIIAHKPMKTIILFDIDGTLTKPRNKITTEMLSLLDQLHKVVDIGVVGGSDLLKIKEQMGDHILENHAIDYVFSENGLVSYHGQTLIYKGSIVDYLGEDKLKRFINFCLRYLADLDIPIKRGTFIELRQSMINISPIGRNCSQPERDHFEQYDRIHHIRQNMIDALKKEFPDYDLKYSIGGQISFDVLGKNFDKTFCLKFLTDLYTKIYFFGDKTKPGENDYELYISPFVEGFSVMSPQETMHLCSQKFLPNWSELRQDPITSITSIYQPPI